jgi:hypothetical protein
VDVTEAAADEGTAGTDVTKGFACKPGEALLRLARADNFQAAVAVDMDAAIQALNLTARMPSSQLRSKSSVRRIRTILGEDYRLFVGGVAAFLVLMLAIGGTILYLFSSSPSQGQALSTSEQFVPVQNTRDWRGALPTDKL